jgi:hypothetical protein
MYWLNKPLYTAEEVATIVRGVLARMLLFVFVGALYSWSFAQIAIQQWKLDRPFVGYIAVTVAILSPFLGSIASYGYWWWKPRPFYRLGRTVIRALVGMWRTIPWLFALRPWRRKMPPHLNKGELPNADSD